MMFVNYLSVYFMQRWQLTHPLTALSSTSLLKSQTLIQIGRVCAQGRWCPSTLAKFAISQWSNFLMSSSLPSREICLSSPLLQQRISVSSTQPCLLPWTAAKSRSMSFAQVLSHPTISSARTLELDSGFISSAFVDFSFINLSGTPMRWEGFVF